MTAAAADDAEGTPSAIRRYVPILEWLPKYERKWLEGDAVAGLTVWSLLVPQSLAYATLAGVPVEYGLYSAFAALVALSALRDLAAARRRGRARRSARSRPR